MSVNCFPPTYTSVLFEIGTSCNALFIPLYEASAMPSVIWVLFATTLLLPILPINSGSLSFAINKSPLSGKPPFAYQSTFNCGSPGNPIFWKAWPITPEVSKSILKCGNFISGNFHSKLKKPLILSIASLTLSLAHSILFLIPFFISSNLLKIAVLVSETLLLILVLISVNLSVTIVFNLLSLSETFCLKSSTFWTKLKTLNPKSINLWINQALTLFFLSSAHFFTSSQCETR